MQYVPLSHCLAIIMNHPRCIVWCAWCVVRHAWCVVRCVWCVHGALWGTGVHGVLCTVGTHKKTASLRSEHKALLLHIQHKAIHCTGSTENGIMQFLISTMAYCCVHQQIIIMVIRCVYMCMCQLCHCIVHDGMFHVDGFCVLQKPSMNPL